MDNKLAQMMRPIDKSRPMIDNGDGSFSTERTITIGADGKYYVIPTIVGGRQLPDEDAIRMWRGGQNPSVGEFDAQETADNYARGRSSEIGRVRRPNQNSLEVIMRNLRDAWNGPKPYDYTSAVRG